ncbi:hypothetical protein BDR22DRAFT_889302 [Usnea florida]
MKTLLKIVEMLGVSLVMSDSVLTPAQSVLSAIQSLEIVKPDITSSTVIGTSCAILIRLQRFRNQRYATLGPTNGHDMPAINEDDKRKEKEHSKYTAEQPHAASENPSGSGDNLTAPGDWFVGFSARQAEPGSCNL